MLDFFDETEEGKEGEEKIASIVKNTVRGELLMNVYIPKEDTANETTEVDLVFLCRKGIIVFESKYYGECVVLGKQNEKYWTVSYFGNRYRLYNPIIQNRNHIDYLSRYLRIPKEYFHSMIVFSNIADLSYLEIGNELVINRDELRNELIKFVRDTQDVMGDKEVSALYQLLKPLTLVSDKIKSNHIEDVNKRYGGDKGRQKRPTTGNPFMDIYGDFFEAFGFDSQQREEAKRYAEEKLAEGKKKGLLHNEYMQEVKKFDDEIYELEQQYRKESQKYTEEYLHKSNQMTEKCKMFREECEKKVSDMQPGEERKKVFLEYEQKRREACAVFEKEKIERRRVWQEKEKRYKALIEEKRKQVKAEKERIKKKYREKWIQLFHEDLPFWLK